MRRTLAIACSVLLLACASIPRPSAMADAESASQSAQAKESRVLAPQAHAAAELLRGRAEQAYRDGDQAGSQILSEHAVAAYGHAFVLARLARAERELSQARQELAKAKTTLADLDEKQLRVAAEADDLELRVKVARDALPLVPSAPASPEREKARLDAARALASQARLLCTATRMIDEKLEGLAADAQRLTELETALAGTAKVAPIDEATKLRSACLKHLTTARKPKTVAAPAAGLADALLSELSRTGELHPNRDDRGIVITLRDLFKGGALTPEGTKILEMLGRVAKAHPEFPVLVVMHGARAGASADEGRRASSVADALRKAGAAKVETATAGAAQPLVDPKRPGANARNERIEIVFVAPAS